MVSLTPTIVFANETAQQTSSSNIYTVDLKDWKVGVNGATPVDAQIINSVKAKKTAVTVEKGKKTAIQLNRKLDMDNVEKITYSTSKKSIATVNKNGTVTTKNSGKVTIQAKVLLKNGKTKTVKMTVTVKS